MRRAQRIRLIGLLATLAVGVVGSTLPAVAQTATSETPGPVVGVLAGWASSQHAWSPSTAVSSRGGPLVGAFAESFFPGGRLSIRAGGSWVRRGSFVTEDSDGAPLDGEVQTDYLSIPVELIVSVPLASARFYLFGGAVLDQLLSAREDPVLAQFLDEPNATILGGSAGLGASIWIGGVRTEAEARYFAGFTPAYSAPFTTVRNRSLEVGLRIGVPLDRLRAGR